jgi:hypothetical protein
VAFVGFNAMGEEASNTTALVKGEAKTGRCQQSVLSRYR